MPEPRVLVIEHQQSCPPGHVGRWLADAGVGLEVLRPYLGDPVPDTLEHDGLLVLGGSMGATEDDRAGWLAPTRALVRSASEAGSPVLGICLGHQLAAVALGGVVGRNPGGQTVGAREVTRDDGPPDPLRDALAATSAIPQWNDDAVLQLPADAQPLAHNDRGDLLMARLAPTVWGIQGHPEADETIVGVWAAQDVADGGLSGASPEEIPGILAAVEERGPAMQAAWRPVVTAWAGLLRP